ncbi:MAG: SMC-Scp complex subunit ScpB [Proteobacteria bacterium]|nr:SMC-Scp complex subunit ScpB [Pseudomonadota bacterium]
MNETYLRNVVEAALLAAGAPVPLADLARLFGEGAQQPGVDELRAALAALAGGYEGRGIELKETASGWRVQVRPELAPEISRLWPERTTRYSRALLETLALIAYRQPITRAEIEAVRGVAVNPNIIRTVIERNWVRVVGHRDVPGHPELLATTRDFLDYFGLKSLDQLPPLAELRAMSDVNLQLALAGEGGATAAALADEDATTAGEAAPAAAEADAEDAGEEDELSAEGGASAELVAAPRHPEY